MYCRECGEKITNEKAEICVKCGTSKPKGENYCPDCGVEVKNKGAEVCLRCGIRLKGTTNIFANSINSIGNSTSNNNKMIAGLIALFLGGMGLHRFYLEYKEIGFIQLGIFAVGLLIFQPVLAVCSIWALVDVVLIFTGKLNNANGTQLV